VVDLDVSSETVSAKGAASFPGKERSMSETAARIGRATAAAPKHSEGVVARTIEGQTARLPSDLYLWAALTAMGASLALQLKGRKEDGLFIGQWAAPFLILGVYNKLVKVAGSDRFHAS
jgi:hypothetical protein